MFGMLDIKYLTYHILEITKLGVFCPVQKKRNKLSYVKF
jgi:hypothetical protein